MHTLNHNLHYTPKVTCPLLYTSEITGTSLRRGAARTMVREVSMQSVVLKTGHDMRGARESAVWEYIDGDDFLLGHASAALAGWPNPTSPIHPPSLTCVMNETNRGKFKAILSMCLDHDFQLTGIKNIGGFVNTMLATFLMYLGEFKCGCETNHTSEKENIIYATFKAKATGSFTWSECLEFGCVIKENFERMNNRCSVKDDGVVLALSRVQEECFKIRTENRELHSEVQSLKGCIARLDERSSALMDIIHSMNEALQQRVPKRQTPMKAAIYSSQDALSNTDSLLEIQSELPTTDEGTSYTEYFMPIHVSDHNYLNRQIIQYAGEAPPCALHLTRSNEVVYQFGVGNNKSLSLCTFRDLVLLSYEMGLTFSEAQKGKGTSQNFQCYIGNPPTLSRSDEARVRTAINLIKAQTTPDDDTTLSQKKPKDGEKIPAWNKVRQEAATRIQEKIVEDVCTKECQVYGSVNKKVPKRVEPKISAVIGRHDVMAKMKKDLGKVKLRGSMASYLSSSSDAASETASVVV